MRDALQPISEGFANGEVEEFLSALKPGTRNVYCRALAVFQRFYEGQGSIRDFLDCIEQDQLVPRNKRRRVARVTLNGFVIWLQNCGYKPKTIRAYVGAVQSFARYFDISISLRYVSVPSAQPVNKKHPWTVEEVVIQRTSRTVANTTNMKNNFQNILLTAINEKSSKICRSECCFDGFC